ncbi:hypothetical protein AB0465_11415 [Streptomyces griseoviridis]|uniref:hypothetical protein n=1 Tax=Streptomyces griseoviridis TaxID=45398 RepID=UPI00344E1849
MTPTPFPSLTIAFVSCATTHPNSDIGEIWETAVILRAEKDGRLYDAEYVWQFNIDESLADPEALAASRFRERHLVAPEWGAAWTGSGPILPCSRTSAITALALLLRGAVLISSTPASSTERFLRKLVGPGNSQWHYRPYDIVDLAVAKVGARSAGPLPWSPHTLSGALGVEPPPEEVAHIALAGAHWARAVHDAVMIQDKFLLPSQPVMTDETTAAPRTEHSYWPEDGDQDPIDEEDDEETGDSDADVLNLISDIASRLRDATDEGEYQAAGLIGDLANGRTTVADARDQLATITFRHV